LATHCVLRSALNTELQSTTRIPIFISKLVLDIGTLNVKTSDLHYYALSKECVDISSVKVELFKILESINDLDGTELNSHPLFISIGGDAVKKQMLAVLDGLIACESLNELVLQVVRNFSNLNHCFRDGVMDSMSFGRLLELSFEHAGSTRRFGPRRYNQLNENLMYADPDTVVNDVNAYISSIFWKNSVTFIYDESYENSGLPQNCVVIDMDTTDRTYQSRLSIIVSTLSKRSIPQSQEQVDSERSDVPSSRVGVPTVNLGSRRKTNSGASRRFSTTSLGYYIRLGYLDYQYPNNDDLLNHMF
jgi:hypothetical protein